MVCEDCKNGRHPTESVGRSGDAMFFCTEGKHGFWREPLSPIEKAAYAIKKAVADLSPEDQAEAFRIAGELDESEPMGGRLVQW